MNKMKKLLSVLLAVVIALSCMSVMASAAKTSYKTVAELETLGAYSPYNQVTRLSTEERTSIVFDALDSILGKANINMGEVFNVLGLSVTIDLTSVDRLCYSLDTMADTFSNFLFSIAAAIINLGIIEDISFDTWATGMSRDGSDQKTILSELLELLSANKGVVYTVLSTGKLDLGIISLGDMSAVESVLGDLPGMVKGMIFGMFERKDDTLTEIKTLDTAMKGSGNVESTINNFVQSLFTDNRSTTTVKYDANGAMTSEHTGMPIVTTAPGTPTDTSPRYVYYKDASGQLWTYHIVDQKEADDSVKDTTKDDLTAYTYYKEEIPYTLKQEVEGSDVYTWQAEDEWGNKWTLKYYNDNSPWLPSLKTAIEAGTVSIDLSSDSVSAGDLLYTMIPYVFGEMAPVVLNGSMKKILGGFFGAKYNYVGDVGSDAVNALADASNAFFTEEQGEYLWEWSNYAVINGNHYYRFEDQIFTADLSNVNNYFDIINWDYEITADFMNEFIPASDSDASVRMLQNVNDFLVKVAETVLVASAETDDTQSDYTATWTRPTFAAGNANLVENIKALAQACIGLAPQHIFGSDYATNERCYYELLMSDDNDTILTGIAAMIVDLVMPSMTLPGKTQILASNAKVGAIIAAVLREFAAQLAPEYNYDALIYADFGTTTADPDKTFVDPETAGLVTTGHTASGYWLDVCLTIGLDVGYEYIRAFADLGEDTTEVQGGVVDQGYMHAGGTYEAGTTQAELNAQWEALLDYIIDWALEKDYEWAWKFENIVTTTGLTIDLATAQDPWLKLETILEALLPVDEIFTVTATDCETQIEQFLRYDFILGIVDLEWDTLLNTLQLNGTNNYFRTGNILDQLAKLLKNVVNGLFAKVGGGSYALIPSAITDFDTLANQGNIATLAQDLVGVLYTAFITNGLADTVFPILNFFLGWTTDPQKIADLQVWTSFRDNNDYAFQWTGNGVYPTMDADNTLIKVLNNSSGMLEKHRNSDVTDHAYDINIRSVTSDATVNTLTFTYDSVVSPYEQVDIKIGGTYSGEEAVTVTIEYDYIGKDGVAVGGTQYTSITFLVSNQYEDSNISGRWDSDDDKDYAGTGDFKSFVFTEDIYTSVTEYTASIYFVKATVNLVSSKDFVHCYPEGTSYDEDCDGNQTVTSYGDKPTGTAASYFSQYEGQAGGWASTIYADSDPSTTTAKLYYANSGVTADTEFPYGAYDMGGVGVKYGSDTKVYYVDFIYYNDYDIDLVWADFKDKGITVNDVDTSDENAVAAYNAYNTALKKVAYLATYPMMTTARNPVDSTTVGAGTSSTDYVAVIMPQIEAAKKALIGEDVVASDGTVTHTDGAWDVLQTYMADAQGSAGADAALPSYVQDLEAELANDDGDGEKEINFQDYEFYEYFNYADLRTAHRNFVKTYYAPDVMDQYYILNSGIREAELNNVIAAESNAAIAAGITASRLENDPEAVSASKAAREEWVQPVNSELLVDDMTSRLAYYRQFVKLDESKEPASHLYFLNQEIAHVEAQQFVEADYTADSWARYADALAAAKAVVDGTDEYATYNSRIFDVKWELMVARKNLLLKADSLIEAGGTAEIMANRATADEIFASLGAADGTWSVKATYVADYLADNEGATEADAKNAAYAALISALGYYYVGEDENTWNLYADSALEYIDNDRPNRQSNQAKVNTANAALVTAIENFEKAVTDITFEGVDTGYVDTVVDENGDPVVDEDGVKTGYVYGVPSGLDATGVEAYLTSTGYIEVMGAGTGAAINVYTEKDGTQVGAYTLVIFGDVNGDAAVTATDSAIIANKALGGTIAGGDAYEFAADANGDLSVSATDSAIVANKALGGEISVNPFAA